MSLDISLKEVRPVSVWSWEGLTHNLGGMADEAGLYEVMWRPEDIGVHLAHEAIPILAKGLALLLAEPERFKKLNPENGWGDYDGLVDCVRVYLHACTQNPNATIKVSR